MDEDTPMADDDHIQFYDYSFLQAPECLDASSITSANANRCLKTVRS